MLLPVQQNIIGSRHKNGLVLAAETLALAILYLGASKLGLAMAYSAKQVTVVWPPTGIALSALLLFGYRIWPGIAIGAFLANVTTDEPALTACAIACGNTLEALIGAALLRHFAGFDNSISRLKDVLSLMVCSAIVGTMVSATIGMASLCLGGVQPWSSYGPLWLLWWLGDATGALIFAPVLLVWSTRPYFYMGVRNVIEMLCMLAGLTIACVGVFIISPLIGIGGHVFIYLIFPFVIWAALRFGQRGTTVVTLAAACTTIWSTLNGFGPFTRIPVSEGLTLLQIFMAAVAATGLLLGAAITERRKAEDALKEADRYKDQFLALLAHELRNPLTPLSNALYTLESTDSTFPQRKEAHTIMRGQLQQMTRLIDDLLDTSRISHGKMELRRAIILLSDVVNNALETVKPLMKEKRQTLSIGLMDEELWLDGDLVRLSQVFSNLLNNAIKYTPEGGKIVLTARRQDGRAVIRISDTGIGIPPDVMPRIFDLFMQVDSSIERSQGGLGIGLTLVKKIVEMHGGQITVKSEGKNMGSEFTLELPLATGTPPEKAKQASPAPPSEGGSSEKPSLSRKPRMLVVDDNKALAKTLGWMAELLGCDVQVAHNGVEAITVAHSFSPDVIMLDIGLSGMNGYEVCEKMRTEENLKRCVIVAQTGWGQDEHRQRSKAAGFDHHLVKPVKIEALEDLLRSLNLPVSAA